MYPVSGNCSSRRRRHDGNRNLDEFLYLPICSMDELILRCFDFSECFLLFDVRSIKHILSDDYYTFLKQKHALHTYNLHT